MIINFIAVVLLCLNIWVLSLFIHDMIRTGLRQPKLQKKKSQIMDEIARINHYFENKHGRNILSEELKADKKRLKARLIEMSMEDVIYHPHFIYYLSEYLNEFEKKGDQ